MATGTARTKQVLLDLYADNDAADINEEDLRDLVETLFDRFDAGPYVPAEEYGVVADGVTDNADALDSAAAANVPIQFPVGTILTSRSFSPYRGFRGHGEDQTILKATDTWLGGVALILLNEIRATRQDFADIKLDGNFKSGHLISTITATWDGLPPKGGHTWTRMSFFGADPGKYLLGFATGTSTTSSPMVGNFFLNTNWNANTGAGVMNLGIATDDMTFINARISHFGKPTVIPIRLDGVDQTFITTYYNTGGDIDTGAGGALINCTSSGSHRNFYNFFLEIAGSFGSYTNLLYAFTGTAYTIEGLSNSGDHLPTNSALVSIATPIAGNINIHNIDNNAGFDALIAVIGNASDSGTLITRVNIFGIPITDIFYKVNSNSMIQPRIHLSGMHGSTIYNHLYFTDGTTEWLSEQPAVSAVSTITANKTVDFADSFKIIRCNIATSGAVVVPKNNDVPLTEGTEIYLINLNAATLNTVAASGVTVNGTLTMAQNTRKTLSYSDVTDEWDLF